MLTALLWEQNTRKFTVTNRWLGVFRDNSLHLHYLYILSSYLLPSLLFPPLSLSFFPTFLPFLPSFLPSFFPSFLPLSILAANRPVLRVPCCLSQSPSITQRTSQSESIHTQVKTQHFQCVQCQGIAWSLIHERGRLTSHTVFSSCVSLAGSWDSGTSAMRLSSGCRAVWKGTIEANRRLSREIISIKFQN